ncbi:MAG TPA: hypothetical protein VFP59_06670 [Candidatus Angelobacter sp.]|nr:hypothetical protein [Candidatus Angelobacter sp.]
MAKHKPDVTPTKEQHNAERTDETPNPHNPADVIQMPVKIDQTDQTAGGVADMDSMFNDADPQGSDAEHSKSETPRRGKTRKKA